MTKVRELRKALETSNATWNIHESLRDEEDLPQYSTGGSKDELKLALDVKRLNFMELFEPEPGNANIIARRIAREFIPRSEVSELLLEPTILEREETPEGGIVPTSLDWRNRWGLSWITTVRDQDGCKACWAFAATALVESMVRIEHAVWTTRSEGDVHKGMGAVCANTGSANTALEWIRDNEGIADPDCFPWTVADIVYTPTPDRKGRTVRIPTFIPVGNVNDQKDWLDTVGPLVTWFAVWTDFFALGNGVYQKINVFPSGKANKEEGGHFMLIVGYDDAAGCWIVKNSWGMGWGDNGYGRIAYGECGIDLYAKTGLQKTNPDPWTKRRLHSGNMIESGNGARHCNFEMLATSSGNRIRHWWRDGVNFSWHSTGEFGTDAVICPTLTSTTYKRNFESVHLTNSNRLHHWYFNQSSGVWKDGGSFGPTDVAGVPGFMQANYGAPGNFEVVVRTADGKLNHLWRINGPPWTWHDGGRFGKNVAHSGATLLQSRYGNKGNFELVCVLNSGRMQHWWRENDHETQWQVGEQFADDMNINSPPCMIEGQYGAFDETRIGNFELCVANNGKIQHWWRDNFGGTGWHHSTIFGHDVKTVVSLVEGSYGFNLEVIVLRTDNKLQHYWRDGRGWHEGVVIGNA